MSEKCFLCGNKIEEGFLGKLDGTIVKIKKGDSNEIHYICKECQKKFKNNLKAQLRK
jgi:hypothetical protein